MVDQRKPLASLLGFVEQVIDVTGRRQEFDQAPCLHLVVQNNAEQATLHLRVYPGTAQASRVFELGIYDAFSREHLWTIRMDGGGLPIDEVHGVPVPMYVDTQYGQLKTAGRHFLQKLERDGYLQQAAYSHTIVRDLSPETTMQRSLEQIADVRRKYYREGYIPLEHHYMQRHQPQEGVLWHRRQGAQVVAHAVLLQYQRLLGAFCQSPWFGTAMVRATIAVRFGGSYFVALSPHECYTTWLADRLTLSVSALLLAVPPLVRGEDGVAWAEYTDEAGAVFVDSHARDRGCSVLSAAMHDIIRARDQHFLYCPNCQRRVGKSTDDPPYACKRCPWRQEAWEPSSAPS